MSHDKQSEPPMKKDFVEERPITKDNLLTYIKELAKEFRRLNGKKTPAEIILIGGASIIANYGFRDMTYDVDAIILASSVMKQAINYVGDKFGLQSGWLNADFTRTDSYSQKLLEVSRYLGMFSYYFHNKTSIQPSLITRSSRRTHRSVSSCF